MASDTRMRYACACCGHRTLEHRPFDMVQRPSAYNQLCDVCLWEDGLRYRNLDSPPLEQAQRHFETDSVSDPDLGELARPASSHEGRPDWFVPLHRGADLAEPEATVEFDEVLYALRSHPDLDSLEELLTSDQARIVARYLAWLLQDPSEGATVLRRSLRRWGRHLDPEQRLHLAL